MASPPDADAERAARSSAARGGLCGRCRHARVVTSSRGSAFLRCDHPATPRYPPMPVLRCAAFAALAEDASGDAGGEAGGGS